MSNSSAMGPFTTSSGACGLVDINSDLPPSGPIWDSALTAATITGMCSGLAPAAAAFTAIFSTVAIPKPGRHVAHDVVGGQADAVYQLVDRAAGGRQQRVSVAPVASQEVVVHALDRVKPVLALKAVGLLRRTIVERTVAVGGEHADQVVECGLGVADRLGRGQVAVDARHDDETQSGACRRRGCLRWRRPRTGQR